MMIFHAGIQYLLKGGWLYIDPTSRVPYTDWLAAGRDYRALTWQHFAPHWQRP